MRRTKYYLLMLALIVTASCERESVTDEAGQAVRLAPLSFSAVGESSESKVTLDFGRARHIQWADDDKVAIFDGTAKHMFGIVPGSNEGSTAIFAGEVTEGASTLSAVYPYDAGESLSGSLLSVRVNTEQFASASSPADPSALVSVGRVIDQKAEFKQVCALLKVVLSESGKVARIVARGNNLAGTVNVNPDGSISDVTSSSSMVSLGYEGGSTFPAGTYYLAVLPGSTGPGSFSIELVSGSGATSRKTAKGAVTFKRGNVLNAGNVDSEASFGRFITTREQLFEWGANMGLESGVTVYIGADIDCESIPWPYNTDTFDGILEGNGHKIYNLVVNSETEACFIRMMTGTVRNLTIGSSDGSTWDGVSSFTIDCPSPEDGSISYAAPIHQLDFKGVLDNVVNFAKIEVSSSTTAATRIGGIAGQIGQAASVTLTGVKNYGSVSNNASTAADICYVAGIVGKVNGKLNASGLENRGIITNLNPKTQAIGGLFADLSTGSRLASSANYGSILNAYATSGGNAYVGGITGQIRGALLSECENHGTITFRQDRTGFVGGIAGLLESSTVSFEDCINQAGGDITVESTKRSYVGGITGGTRSANVEGVTISGCKNHASVTNVKGASDVGGIAGQIWTSNSSAISIVISNCENTGVISSVCAENEGGNTNNLNLGGIFGQLDPDANSIHTVSSCRNSGTISASGALSQDRWVALGGIGGVAGKALTVKDCENTGSVTFSGTTGAIKQALYAGGIMGNFSTSTASRYITIDSCINRGEVTSDRGSKANYVGGIAGQTNTSGFGSVKDCVNYAGLSVTSDITASRIGGVVGKNHCQASGNCNYGSVSDGTGLSGAGACSGAIAGENSSSLNSITVCDAVTVCGLLYSEASDKAAWVCPNDTGSINSTLTAHSSDEHGTDISGEGGYLFAHTGFDDNYYKLFYAISRDGLSWTELNGGASPMNSYWGFPYITRDAYGTFWLIGTDNGSLPHHPVIWSSSDAVSWSRKDLPASIMTLPEGYVNDTNSYGAMKVFFDPVSEQFIITWHASEAGLSGDAKWESMRTFYILTKDFKSFTPAAKLFSFTGSDANMAQIDASIHYYSGRYYAVIKDERTKDSSSAYYKRPRIAVSASLTGPWTNPGGALTDKYREAPSLVKSPDGAWFYLYVENYGTNPNTYELYRSTSLTATGWSKVGSFSPPPGGNCRHGCVIRIDEKTYRRLQAAY